MTAPWGPVSRLAPGDVFGPVAADEDHPQTPLLVVDVRRSSLRGQSGRLRNLWEVTDQFGRVWRTGGARLAGDCYGWVLVRRARRGAPS